MNDNAMNADTVRSALPPGARGAFDDIVEYRVLGASKHIAMIGEMFGAIAADGVKSGQSAAEMLERVSLVAEYFTETRGKASSAVANAIIDMTRGMDAWRSLDTKEASKNIAEALSRFSENARASIEKILGYMANVTRGMSAIMAFDYSSTIARFLEKGQVGKVFIPESRTINGGRNYVEACMKSSSGIHFIPDAAMLYYLRECDAAFIGAETFYPDGTAFNTTGSDILGLACADLNIPLYVPTTLNKLDWQGAYGTIKEPVMQDLRGEMLLKLGGLDVSRVDFITPELLPVPPKHITAYITEQGIIPSAQMYGVCRAMAAKRGITI